VTSTLRTFTRAPSSSSSASSPHRDSYDDYPEIEASACENSTEDSRLILMVTPNEDRSRNSSSGYPTIGRSEVSDVQTPSAGLVRNLNPDFNAIWVQVIMQTIQRMSPDGSPLALLAQQWPEAANLIVAEKSAGVPQRELFVSHNDRVRCARSEAASSASSNRYLAENDVRQRITQNRQRIRFYGFEVQYVPRLDNRDTDHLALIASSRVPILSDVIVEKLTKPLVKAMELSSQKLIG
jgi:hypothetical protein